MFCFVSHELWGHLDDVLLLLIVLFEDEVGMRKRGIFLLLDPLKNRWKFKNPWLNFPTSNCARLSNILLKIVLKISHLNDVSSRLSSRRQENYKFFAILSYDLINKSWISNYLQNDRFIKISTEKSCEKSSILSAIENELLQTIRPISPSHSIKSVSKSF